MHQTVNVNKVRIRSIDALRAVVLLGILLVHTVDGFGFSSCSTPVMTTVGAYIKSFVSQLLVGRCNIVFSILFGVSFYLILRNPQYTALKFIWRCFILVCIGVINKIFYTYDALVWYGILGMVLVAFRKMSVRQLWISFILLYAFNFFISHWLDFQSLVFGTYVPPYTRYSSSNSLLDVVKYPIGNALLDYARAVIRSPFSTLISFLLGYSLAKSGIIDNIRKYSNIKYFIISLLIYIVSFVLGKNTDMAIAKSVSYMAGAICYALFFLCIYYYKDNLFHFLEPYGKLGLTNYSMQGVVGVTLNATLFQFYKVPFEWSLALMLLFYILQLFFSIVWLNHFRYGPMEYVWRCATERTIIENKIMKKVD